MKKFPKIGQFRNVCHLVNLRASYDGKDENDVPVYKSTFSKPTLSYRGTVKLHGTNAGVTLLDGELIAQSRNQIVTSGHYGFCDFVAANSEALKELLVEGMTIFGEWCGEGVQSGVGISKLPKMFVVFGKSYDYGSVQPYTDKIDALPILSIEDFPTFEIDIDFERPNDSAIKLESIVVDVEGECPVAAQLGEKSGVGEGVVWKCTTEGYESSEFWFKTKGEKHNVTKVKTLVSKDPELVANIDQFVEITVTDSRLDAIYSSMKEEKGSLSRKETGIFIKTARNDVFEEESDTLEANGLAMKDVGTAVSTAARKWFFSKLDSEV